VIQGVGTRIYTRVRGPLHRGLDVTGATTKSSIGALSFISDDARGSARFQVRNTGNVSLNAMAKAKAVDTFGHTIKQFAPTRIGPLLPGARVTINEPTAQGAKASGDARQFIIPWLLLAILAALLAAFILWRWQRRRRRRRGSQHPTPPEPEPEPETAVVP
jgi:cytochrome oxidase assembly protein ShyY1